MKQEDDRDPLIVLFCYVSDVPGHCGRRDLKINDYRKTYLKGKKKTEIKITRNTERLREGRTFVFPCSVLKPSFHISLYLMRKKNSFMCMALRSFD